MMGGAGLICRTCSLPGALKASGRGIICDVFAGSAVGHTPTTTAGGQADRSWKTCLFEII